MDSDYKTQEFSDALKALTEIGKSFTIDIPVPSLSNKIKFKELNAKQQKLLLETVTDDSLYKIQFSKQFNKIIKDNNLSNISTDKFTVFDKMFIALYLRSSVSNKLNVVFSENPSVIEEINLSSLLERTNNYQHPKEEVLFFNKADNDIKVTLNVPSLDTEELFESELYKNYKKINDIKSPNEVGTVLSNAFIGEISKYIAKISLNAQDIIFTELTVPQRTKLVEQIPGDIIQKLLEKITEWKEQINHFVTVETSDKNYSKVLNLDALLFLM